MIAVTGANGLLGSFIIKALVKAGYPVIAIKRETSDMTLVSAESQNVNWRNADVTDPVALQEALKGATHVIHAAAIVSFNPYRYESIFNVNVNGTRNVVDACLAENVKQLIHVSSVAALGRQKDQNHIDENNKWVDSPANSVYAESKYKAELEVFRGQEEGLQTTIVNPSVILAAANWDKSSAKLFKYVWDEKAFYIDAYLNYVDVRDVAEIILRLLDHPTPGERYIVSASTVHFSDFFSLVAKNFSRKPPAIKLDRTMLRIIAGFESLRSRIVRTEPLITKETARLANTRFTYSNEKIRNTLNYSFKPIENTIDWCSDYYLNYYAKK